MFSAINEDDRNSIYPSVLVFYILTKTSINSISYPFWILIYKTVESALELVDVFILFKT